MKVFMQKRMSFYGKLVPVEYFTQIYFKAVHKCCNFGLVYDGFASF